MTDYKGIYVKNVFYMLAYAFGFMNQRLFQDLSSESFDDVENLLSLMLLRGTSYQLKAGLYKEYVNVTDDISSLRGSLNIPGEIQNKAAFKQKLSCNFDELSVDNIYNQIVKTTLLALLESPTLKETIRSQIKNILRFFQEVETVSFSSIKWSTIKFSKNNSNYRILLNVCRLILKNYIPSSEKGTIRMSEYISPDEMARLYEKFILEYYRFYHKDAKPSPLCIQWNLDDTQDTDDFGLLPKMQTDTTMEKDGKTLIIDAKFYGHMLQHQERFESESYHSGNMYQIFSYVKNKDVKKTGKVSGVLLYAKTHEDAFKENDYSIGGNRIAVRMLDLEQPFNSINKKLEYIYVQYLSFK